MKRNIVTLVIVCMLFSGCGVSLTESGSSMQLSKEIFEEKSDSSGENLDEIGIDEIEDNWPESIRYSAEGVYANPRTAKRCILIRRILKGITPWKLMMEEFTRYFSMPSIMSEVWRLRRYRSND